MYELTVIIGRGRVIVGTARGWHLFMEEGFGDGGGGVYVSSQFQNFRQFFVTILMNETHLSNKYNSISNCIIDMSSFLPGEIHNTENISYRDFYRNNLASIFCLKVSRNTPHDNPRCFNLSSKYRFYLYCNLRR